MNRLLLGSLLLTAALAAWANRPDPDPWSEVPVGEPHPRIGARVTLAPGRWVHLPPPELSPRTTDGPGHWRDVLPGRGDREALAALPPPDQEERSPDGRTHRFWHSWCPHDDDRWVVHLWVESLNGRIAAVHMVAGGGRLLGEAPPETAPPPPGVGPRQGADHHDP